MHKPHEPQPPQGERDYADLDIPVRGIVMFGVYIALFTVVSFVGVKLLFRAFEADRDRQDQPATAFSATRVLPPAPQLLTDEPRSWQQQLAAEKALLEGYAWVDTNAGVVRIPVDRAMDLVAERGLPVRQEPSRRP